VFTYSSALGSSAVHLHLIELSHVPRTEAGASDTVGLMDSSPVKVRSAEHQMSSVAERFRSYSARQIQIAATIGDRRSGFQASEPMPAVAIPFEDLVTARAGPGLSPFEDVIAAVTSLRATRPEVEPTSPRFMVRVADVGRPHRSTKRDYDYFAELNAALAERAIGRDEELQDRGD